MAVAKSVSSEAYGPSPGAKQSCSNLTGRYHPSAICSNAVRAKLPVKIRSSGSSSLSTHLKVPYPQYRCISTERTMCAGFAARGRSGLQGRELHWSAPVKLTAVQSSPWLRCGSYFPSQAPTNQHRKRGPPTHHQEPRNHQDQKRKSKSKTRGGSETAKDQSD